MSFREVEKYTNNFLKTLIYIQRFSMIVLYLVFVNFVFAKSLVLL